MKRIPLDSSCLAAAGYDPQRHRLEIEFHNGGLYRYVNVPAEIHQGLLQAESHGAYFNAEIRDCYRFLLVRQPRPRGGR